MVLRTRPGPSLIRMYVLRSLPWADCSEWCLVTSLAPAALHAC